MVEKISIQNALSFKNEVTLSFEPVNDRRLEEYHLVDVRDGVKLLKLGIIYGANASGKSNFIKAYGAFRELLLRRGVAKTSGTGITPFLLDDHSAYDESRFSITFYTPSGFKYVYSLSATTSEITSERLLLYRTQQPALIYERTTREGNTSIKFGNSLSIPRKVKSDLELRCLQNMTLLAAYLEVNHTDVRLQEVTDYISTRLLMPVTPLTSMTRIIESMSVGESQAMSKYLRKADFNIIAIQHMGKEEKIVTFTHEVDDGANGTKTYNLKMDAESDGTIHTIGLALMLYKAIESSALLPVDEVETSLHSLMIDYIVERFLCESKGAQLLLTTHHSGFLRKKDSFRSDNFWFTSKDRQGASSLYPMTDFGEIDVVDDYQLSYLAGIFGAIPNL